MNEFEPGKPYTASDGKLYTWSGKGDPKDKANWSPYEPSAPAAEEQQVPDWRENRFTGPKGEQPMFDPKGLLKAAGMALPLAGPTGAGALNIAARLGLGAASGATMGAAENGVAGAKTGALVGTAAGAVGEVLAPALGWAARSAAGRGARIGNWLREAAEAQDWGRAMDRVKASLKEVQKTLYGPIQDQLVPDAEIRQILDKVKANNWLPRGVDPDNVTVKQLQDLRAALRKKSDTGLAERLDEVLQAKVPGLKEADAAWFQAQQRRRAMVMGARNATKTGAEIEQAAQAFAGDYANDFRAGVVHRWATRLETRNKQTVAALEQIMDAGPETQRIFRTMFDPAKGGYDAFVAEVAKEKTARAAQQAFKKYGVPLAQWLATATAVGAGGTYAVSRMNRGGGAPVP